MGDGALGIAGYGLVDPGDPLRRVEPAVAQVDQPAGGAGDGDSTRVVRVVAGGIGLGRRGLAEEPAEVDEVLLGGGALLELGGAPFGDELAGCDGFGSGVGMVVSWVRHVLPAGGVIIRCVESWARRECRAAALGAHKGHPYGGRWCLM